MNQRVHQAQDHLLVVRERSHRVRKLLHVAPQDPRVPSPVGRVVRLPAGRARRARAFEPLVGDRRPTDARRAPYRVHDIVAHAHVARRGRDDIAVADAGGAVSAYRQSPLPLRARQPAGDNVALVRGVVRGQVTACFLLRPLALQAPLLRRVRRACLRRPRDHAGRGIEPRRLGRSLTSVRVGELVRGRQVVPGAPAHHASRPLHLLQAPAHLCREPASRLLVERGVRRRQVAGPVAVAVPGRLLRRAPPRALPAQHFRAIRPGAARAHHGRPLECLLGSLPL